MKDLEIDCDCNRDDERSHVFSINDETKSDMLPHEGNEDPMRHARMGIHHNHPTTSSKVVYSSFKS